MGVWSWLTGATYPTIDKKQQVGTVHNPYEGKRDEEKLRSGPSGVLFPFFLPYLDELQTVGETEEMRRMYRFMLRDPNIKAPVLDKIFGVASLEIKVNPSRKDDERQKIMADFIHWNFTRRLSGGVPEMVWSILSGALIDGYSLCEKVWGVHDKGRWAGKTVLRGLKPKDTDQDLVIYADEFRNITGVMGLRYNPGVVYSPKDFLIFRHMPLYGNPVGMSDFRAVYGRFWILDTVTKLRAMGAEKRALPVVSGSYTDSTKLPALERALAAVKSQNWLAVPESVKIQVHDIAGQANDYFSSFCADLREEIVMGIAGATLQTMAATAGKMRGDSGTHKDTTDLRKWFLSVCILGLLNDYENGLIREMTDENFVNVDEYPYATMAGVDDMELGETLKIDMQLQQMGFKHKIEDIAERYGRQPATDEDEPLVSIQEQQSQQAQGAGNVPGLPAPDADLADKGEDLSQAEPVNIPTLDKFSEKYGEYTVKIVDDEKLRDTNIPDEDFGDMGTHVLFPKIPRNEIWIAETAAKDERKYFIANGLAQLKASKAGMSDSKAYDKGLAIEKAMRKKGNQPTELYVKPYETAVA